MNSTRVAGARVLLGAIMAWGGVMHFTVDERVWHSSLLDAMARSGFLWREIGIINIAAGTALLMNRAVPLASLILAPITTNIFLFHLFRQDLSGLSIGVPVIALNTILIVSQRSTYKNMLRATTEQDTDTAER